MESKYSKEEFLRSKSIGFPREVIDACLLDDKMYTKKEAFQIIEKYLKKNI